MILIYIITDNRSSSSTNSDFLHHISENHLHDGVISREGAWIHKTSLSPTHLIEVSVPSQTNQGSSVCQGYRICLFLWFFYRILELFRQFSIFLLILLNLSPISPTQVSDKTQTSNNDYWKIDDYLLRLLILMIRIIYNY